MTVAAPLAIGLAFGWLLHRGGLSRHEVIVGVYRFTDFTVLKFLLTALVVGAAAVQAAASLGLATAVPVPTTRVLANLLGGGLFGIGMSFAGFCPGTIVAGGGAGQLDYLLPGVAGLFTGALLFGVTFESIGPALRGEPGCAPTTIPGALGVSGWLVVIVLGEVAALLFYAIERGVRPGRARR